MAIIIVLIVLNSIGCMVARIKPDLTGVIAIGMTIITVVSILFLIGRRKSRCENPNCRKTDAYVEVGRTLRDIRHTTKNVEKSFYDPKTGHKEYYMDTVPAVELIYDVKLKCRYCGHEKTDDDIKIQ